MRKDQPRTPQDLPLVDRQDSMDGCSGGARTKERLTFFVLLQFFLPLCLVSGFRIACRFVADSIGEKCCHFLFVINMLLDFKKVRTTILVHPTHRCFFFVGGP